MADVIDLSKDYAAATVPVQLSALDYRTTVIEPAGDASYFYIDGAVEQVQWSDDSTVMSGTLGLIEPQFTAHKLSVRHGTMIQQEILWFGKYVPIWQMRVHDPERTLEDGALNAQLYDEGYNLQISQDDFHYRRHAKRKPDGWRCDEILMDVARRYRIKLGRVAKGSYLIKSLEMTGVSPLDCIARAYALERQQTGRRFVMRWHGDKLHVVPFTRNPLLYSLAAQIRTMDVATKSKDSFATALTGRGSIKEGSKHKKFAITALSPALKEQGYVHKQVQLHGIDSTAEAQERLKRSLATRQRHQRQVTIEHGLIPFIRRGDAVEIHEPQYGFYGRMGILWVSSASYILASDPTMSLTLDYQDPLADPKQAQADKDKAARKANRRA